VASINGACPLWGGLSESANAAEIDEYNFRHGITEDVEDPR